MLLGGINMICIAPTLTLPYKQGNFKRTFGAPTFVKKKYILPFILQYVLKNISESAIKVISQ